MFKEAGEYLRFNFLAENDRFPFWFFVNHSLGTLILKFEVKFFCPVQGSKKSDKQN